MELVSVIIPIYNSEKYLEKNLESVIKQSYTKIEILLINDGSTDDSKRICDNYQKCDNRIRVIHKDKNEGLVRARKTGIAEARGSYISFVDSDDWIEPDFIQFLVDKVVQTQSDIVCTGIIAEYENRTEFWKNKIEEQIYEGSLKTKLYRNMLCLENYYEFGVLPNVWNKLFKKDILSEIYPHVEDDITYGEDAAVVYPALLKAERIYITNEAKYHYCIRQSSMSFEKGKKLCNSLYCLHKTMKKFFCESEYSGILMEQLMKYIVYMDVHNLKMVYSIDLNISRWERRYQEIINKKVILYGAGKVGRELCGQFVADGNVELILWVDKKYNEFEKNSLFKVYSPEMIMNVQFDYIVIGVKSEELAISIEEEISRLYGVPKEKILWREPINWINAKWMAQ